MAENVSNQLHGNPRKTPKKGGRKKILAQNWHNCIPLNAAIPFEQLANTLLLDYRVNGNKSLERAQSSIKWLRRFFGDIPMDTVKRRHIQQYKLWRLQETNEPANGTINRELSALKRMFQLAVIDDLILEAPKFPEALKENNVREGFINQGEFQRIREAAPEFLKPYLIMLFETGFRKREAMGLIWDEVHDGPESTGKVSLTENKIILKHSATKSGRGRVVYLTENLRNTLQSQKSLRDQTDPSFPWVFFRRLQTGRLKKVKNLEKAWRKTKIDAETPHDFWIHDFRRSAIRNMDRAGISQRVAMEISGHKTRAIFDRYNIINENDLQEAANKLSRLSN